MDYDAVDLAKVSPLHGQTEIALVSTDDTTSASLEIDDPVPLQDTEEGATVDPGIEDGFGTLPTAAELSRPEDPVPTSTPEASAHVLGVPDLLAATREKCTICLAPYEEDDELRILRCKHGFHSECIDQWLTSHVNNCPMCRQPGVTTTINPTPHPLRTDRHSLYHR
ncbi:hypothetical protein BC829DRAFT_382776 [Chytridium lagenaria]|nr:hypothetical protein BC829DRAFT_382776 [Chytridium lagenaria]